MSLQLMENNPGVDALSVDEVRNLLRQLDLPYSWLATQLGVAPSTVNQWLRPSDPTPFPRWAAVSAARLFREFAPSETELGREEMDILTEWAQQEGIGPLQLAIRILREEIAARKKK